MIDKIIIAEDHESTNFSIQKTMEDMNIRTIDQVYYCDDALQKVKTAIAKNSPYDLLITDIYFEEDGTKQKIAGGIDLIKSVREVQPSIRIMIFSLEKRQATIEMLYHDYAIDAYVPKARHDSRELKKAIERISQGERYYPPHLVQSAKQTKAYEFSEFDITVLRLLSNGYQQKDIPTYLKQNNIRPSSLSMVEKRLKQIKDEHEFSTNEQLVLFCNEKGLL